MDWTFWALVLLALLGLIWNFSTTIQLTQQQKKPSTFSIAQLMLFTLGAALAVKLVLDATVASKLFAERSSQQQTIEANERRLERDRDGLQQSVNDMERNQRLASVVTRAIKQADKSLGNKFSDFIDRARNSIDQNHDQIGLIRIPIANQSSRQNFDVREYFVHSPARNSKESLGIELFVISNGEALDKNQREERLDQICQWRWESENGGRPMIPKGTSQIQWVLEKSDDSRSLLCLIDGQTIGQFTFRTVESGYLGFSDDREVGEAKFFDADTPPKLLDLYLPFEESEPGYLSKLRFQLEVVNE